MNMSRQEFTGPSWKLATMLYLINFYYQRFIVFTKGHYLKQLQIETNENIFNKWIIIGSFYIRMSSKECLYFASTRDFEDSLYGIR